MLELLLGQFSGIKPNKIAIVATIYLKLGFIADCLLFHFVFAAWATNRVFQIHLICCLIFFEQICKLFVDSSLDFLKANLVHQLALAVGALKQVTSGVLHPFKLAFQVMVFTVGTLISGHVSMLLLEFQAPIQYTGLRSFTGYPSLGFR